MQNAIDRIEQVKVSHNQYHEAIRELHQKNIELDDLRKALSEAQTAIFEERKHLLRVIAENDEMKSKCVFELIRNGVASICNSCH